MIPLNKGYFWNTKVSFIQRRFLCPNAHGTDSSVFIERSSVGPFFGGLVSRHDFLKGNLKIA